MKLKFINLALLLFSIILSSCGNQKKNVSTESSDVQENMIESSVAVSAPDTIVVQEAIDLITEFYKICLAEHPSKSLESVNIKLTKALEEKIVRIATEINASPVIRAQDVSDDTPETVTVKHLSGNWYMVSYTWGKGGNYEETKNIPLRVARIDGQYMIDYITPEWNGELYGDSLLCDNPVMPTVDNSDALSFLKTFYDAYTMEYCSMPEGLTARLADMRAKYLTSNAMKQFEAAEKEELKDTHAGYDLLILGFDFDNLWRPFMKITSLGGDTYQVSYSKSRTLKIKVIKQGQQYRIDSITEG